MTTKKSNWPIRMKKKSKIVAEVSYTTNWCSQDIRLKQSRILHSVLLIMESVIILRHFFRFWVQPHSIFNNLFAGPFWNVCDSDCLRPVRSNLQRWDFGEILKVFGKRNYARVAENGSSMGEEQKEYHLMIIYDQQTLTRIHCNVQFLKKIIWRRKFSFKKICHFVDVKLAHSLCWRVKHVGCPINCPPGNEDVSRFYCFIDHFILNILWTHHSLQNYPSDNDIVCV